MTQTSGPSRFLDLSGIDQLPLWAQVTLAARLVRRMAMGWSDLTVKQREPMLLVMLERLPSFVKLPQLDQSG